MAECTSPCGTRAQFKNDGGIHEVSSRAGLENGSSLHIEFDIREQVPDSAALRLMAAVLQDAIQSYTRNVHARSARRRMEFLEVRSWFNAKNQPGVFGFENLCDMLGINADWLRRSLRLDACQRPRRQSLGFEGQMARRRKQFTGSWSHRRSNFGLRLTAARSAPRPSASVT